jgi:hypothetical protein
LSSSGRGRHLISVDLKFVTEDAAEPLAERIREAVANIVGRQALEEFRWRDMPLDADRKRGPS